jgi:hypothetical protein
VIVSEFGIRKSTDCYKILRTVILDEMIFSSDMLSSSRHIFWAKDEQCFEKNLSLHPQIKIWNQL